MDNFERPERRLVRFFKRSRDAWKVKAPEKRQRAAHPRSDGPGVLKGARGVPPEEPARRVAPRPPIWRCYTAMVIQ